MDEPSFLFVNELKKLKRLAEKATPGPWKYDSGNWEIEDNNRNVLFSLHDDTGSIVENCFSNAEYIEALNPELIKIMVDICLSSLSDQG